MRVREADKKLTKLCPVLSPASHARPNREIHVERKTCPICLSPDLRSSLPCSLPDQCYSRSTATVQSKTCHFLSPRPSSAGGGQFSEECLTGDVPAKEAEYERLPTKIRRTSSGVWPTVFTEWFFYAESSESNSSMWRKFFRGQFPATLLLEGLSLHTFVC